MWTRFMDMNSGGGQKEKWSQILIEAPEEEARLVFYNRFGHNPDRVTCTCCGNDYSVTEEDTLDEATDYYRELEFKWQGVKPKRTTEKFLKDNEEWLVICAEDIKPDERKGELPTQGYVWQ